MQLNRNMEELFDLKSLTEIGRVKQVGVKNPTDSPELLYKLDTGPVEFLQAVLCETT